MVRLNLYSKKLRQVLIACVCALPAYAGVLTFVDPTQIASSHRHLIVNVDAFLTNDPFTLKDLFNGIKTDSPHIKNGTNIALGDVRADLGYYHKDFGYVGYLYKEEIVIESNDDTIELLYLATNKKKLPVGKNYDLYFDIKAFAAQGIEYANRFDVCHGDEYECKIGFAFDLLQGKDMQDGIVGGYGHVNSTKDYSFDINTNYNYTHNYLYKLDVKGSSSYGFSSNISFFIKKGDIALLLLGNDVFGKLYWKELPYSYVNLTSNRKYYDKNGYVRYKPYISGYEGYHDYVQRLMPKYRAQLSYSKRRYNFKIGCDTIDGIYMPYLEGDYQLFHSFKIGVGYETRFHSVSLKTAYKKLLLKARVDDLSHPSTAGLQIYYRF